MTPSRRPWRRWHRQEPGESQVETGSTAHDREAATKEVKELENEVAELHEQADELRLQLKESEARLGAVEDDGREQARTIDMLLAWCQEQEAVLAQHRDVVAAMGAAARTVEKDAFLGGPEPELTSHEEQPTAFPPPPTGGAGRTRRR
jgi:transposase-like protein